MLDRARNPIAVLALGIGGVLVFVVGAAAVVAPQDPVAPEAVPVTTTSTVAPAPHVTTTTTSVASITWEPAEEPAIDSAALRPAPHRPTTVRIDKIGVDATIIDLGLNPDRTLEVPEDIRLTGWWTGRSVPGEPGPSIVVGHVDSAALGPGVFWRLRELEVGDVVHVERSDGSIAEFRVTETELVLKDEFPTEKVYGSVEGSKLRLITCGGTFDQSTRSYLGNLIVYAEHVATIAPPLPDSLGLIA